MYYRHDALDNFQTLPLANKRIPSTSTQLGMLTMVKMKSRKDMPALR